MFASLAFLLYDHALTFDAEMMYVWKHPSRWSFGKILLVFNRYFGPFTLVFNIFVYVNPSVTITFCEGFHWWETTSEAVAVLTVELILMTRIYAVYDRSRKLLFVLGALFLAEIAGTLVIVDIGLPHGIPRPFPELAGCFVGAQPPLYFLTWIPALAFESVLCFLMLYKAWRMHKDEYSSALLNLIIRDSVLYFLTIFATLLLNCLIWALASENFLEIALGWAVALPCALGSRLLLNMRERMYREETSQRSPHAGIEMQSFRAAAARRGQSTMASGSTVLTTLPTSRPG